MFSHVSLALTPFHMVSLTLFDNSLIYNSMTEVSIMQHYKCDT